jgi:hypothetical protein
LLNRCRGQNSYREKELIGQIGRELAVQYVLEGSVGRDSGRVRITVQLVQMKDQTSAWSRQYDRDLSNFLALQGEIAQEIADEIELTLRSGRERVTLDLARVSPPGPGFTNERWLLYKYVGGEFTPVSRAFKTKQLAEKARLKYPERERRIIGVGVIRIKS